MSALHGPQRPIALEAVRGLIKAARAERAALSVHAPERQFYLGVEAAAEEILHPELASARSEEWLDRESSAFRDGYLQTANLLAVAMTAPQPPFRLPLPNLRGAH
ncbi:MAG TPA: hypothetical protein VM282_07605 [Acidimicrobiales bacterium]|nr:hypothetical protein [Acidimicrobiales bacterium]